MFLYYNQITDLDKKALLKKKGFCKYFKLPPNKRRPNLIKSTIKIHLIQGYIKKTPTKGDRMCFRTPNFTTQV